MSNEIKSRLEKEREKLDKLEKERIAAWGPPPAQKLPCLQWEADWAPKNYHSAFQRWDAQRLVVLQLEKQLAR
jgi:hypothetical protein